MNLIKLALLSYPIAVALKYLAVGTLEGYHIVGIMSGIISVMFVYFIYILCTSSIRVKSMSIDEYREEQKELKKNINEESN